METPLTMYYAPASSGVPEVIVAPVDVRILGQGRTVGSRMTPKKGGEDCEGRGGEDE
jgi:hypothetical protein